MNAEFAGKLAPADFTAARAAAAIMGMNNVHYRFLHLSENAEYLRLPASLRMNVIAALAGRDRAKRRRYALSGTSGSDADRVPERGRLPAL